ncbi:MAG TPA: SAM-dependent methyltransferase [Candidatus Polarisedimenticolia bacterium]|nr:SAM-dependent methyltransferase [Candidatus Polarisedimenticolia bacterium]
MDPGVPELLAAIRERIDGGGPLRFDRFMEMALYHPAHGYYCRPGMTTGAAGDFYTSPDVHSAFGELLARQVAQIADLSGGGPFRVVEMGPGSGRLARDLAAALCRSRPDVAGRATLTLVEISPALRRAQAALLEGTGPGPGGPWIEWASWEEVAARAQREGFRGCVVANEFLDALPVRRVERRGGRLLEVHVSCGEGRLEETLLPPEDGAPREWLEALGVELSEGQRADLGLAARDWIRRLGALLRQGTGGAVIVDYGHPASRLYGPGRDAGTLMCYAGHRAQGGGGDPYEGVGRKDMTAHVDLTTIAAAAREAGLDVAGPISQMRFLVSLGIASMLAGLGSRPDAASAGPTRERLALHALIAPGGMGEVFQVLLMARGFPARSLIGARDPFRAARGDAA